jgi:hypothetical protein
LLHKLISRARNDRGHAQVAVLTPIAIAGLLVLIAATTWLATSSAAATVRPSAQASATSLLYRAQQTASAIAHRDDGSFVRIGQINLRKAGQIRIAPSTTTPWISSASGGSRSYRITVSVEPGGRTITAIRSPSGALTTR